METAEGFVRKAVEWERRPTKFHFMAKVRRRPIVDKSIWRQNYGHKRDEAQRLRLLERYDPWDPFVVRGLRGDTMKFLLARNHIPWVKGIRPILKRGPLFRKKLPEKKEDAMDWAAEMLLCMGTGMFYMAKPVIMKLTREFWYYALGPVDRQKYLMGLQERVKVEAILLMVLLDSTETEDRALAERRVLEHEIGSTSDMLSGPIRVRWYLTEWVRLYYRYYWANPLLMRQTGFESI